jgi:hypothetical protein
MVYFRHIIANILKKGDDDDDDDDNNNNNNNNRVRILYHVLKRRKMYTKFYLVNMTE